MKKILFYILTFCITSTTLAQPNWENLTNPPTIVSKIAEHNGRLWATDGNLYFSDNDGITWERHPDFLFDQIDDVKTGNFGITVTRRRTYEIDDVISSVIHFRYVDIFNSPDGEIFTLSENPLPLVHGSATDQRVTSLFQRDENTLLAVHWTTPFLGTKRLKVSQDGGLNWDNYDHTEWSLLHLMSTRFSVFEDSLKVIYKYNPEDYYIQTYTDNYAEPISNTLLPPLPESFFVKQFAYREEGIYITSFNEDIAFLAHGSSEWIDYIYDFGSGLTNVDIDQLVFSDEGIFMSINQQLWFTFYDNLSNATLVHEGAGYRGIRYMETENYQILRDANGLNIRSSSEEEFVTSEGGISSGLGIQGMGEVIWAHAGNAWHRSEDFGETWTFVTDYLFSTHIGLKFVGEIDDTYFMWREDKLYSTTNVNEDFEFLSDWLGDIETIETPTGLFFIGADSLKFTSDGTNLIDKNMPASGAQFVWHENQLIALTTSTRYLSEDMGETWTATEISGSFSGKLVSTLSGLAAAQNGPPCYIYRSVDSGLTWALEETLSPYRNYSNGNYPARMLLAEQGVIFYLTNQQLQATANAGYSFSPITGEFLNYYSNFSMGNTGDLIEYFTEGPHGLVVVGDYLFASTAAQGIYRVPFSEITDELSNIAGNLVLTVENEVDVCEGEEFNGVVFNTDTVLSEMVFGDVADTIYLTNITVWPTYENIIFEEVGIGEVIAGTQIFSDTIIIENNLTWQGCDSVLIYEVSVITNIHDAENQLFSGIIFPNPTSGNSKVIITAKEELELNATLLSARGEVLFNIFKDQRVRENEFTFEMHSESLPVGVYYLQLSSGEGIRYLKFVKSE